MQQAGKDTILNVDWFIIYLFNFSISRAHTIVAINLVQKYKNDAGKEMAKSSVINLVDLAGSERADQTGKY